MKTLFAAAGVTALLGASLAFAHPHDEEAPHTSDTKVKIIKKMVKDDTESKTQDETFESHFDEHRARLKSRMEKVESKHKRAIEKYSKNFDFKGEDLLSNPESLREAARSLEGIIAESGLISNLADMLADLAEDVEITDSEDGTSLKFDGKEIGRFKAERDSDDSVEIETLGRNMTLEKETYMKDGKKKTRIIIEMDGGDDVEVEVKPKTKSGF